MLLIKLLTLCHCCGHKHSLPTLRAEASTTVRSTLNIGFTTHGHLSTVVADLLEDWKRHVGFSVRYCHYYKNRIRQSQIFNLVIYRIFNLHWYSFFKCTIIIFNICFFIISLRFSYQKLNEYRRQFFFLQNIENITVNVVFSRSSIEPRYFAFMTSRFCPAGVGRQKVRVCIEQEYIDLRTSC